MAVSTYYFNASDAGPTDPGGVWTSDANAFDGNTGTFASTTTGGSTSSNYLMGEGTNAPTSGNTITQVRARIRASTADPETVSAAIYTDGLGELLGTPTRSNVVQGYGSYVILSTPSGGWTWQKINDLETKIYLSNTSTFVSIVEIEVTFDPILSVSDSSTVTDSTSSYVDLVLTRESYTVSIQAASGGTDLSINKSESITVTESIALLIPDLYISTSDNSTITESIKLLEESYVNVNDNSTVTESKKVTLESQILVSDNTTLTDTPQVQIQTNIIVNDTTTVTDTVNLLIPTLFLTVNDSIGVTDTPVVSIGTIGTYNISVFDTVTSTENVIVDETISINVVENISVTESLSRELNSFIAKSDSVTLTENLIELVESYVNKSESVTITESTTEFIPTLFISVNDSVTATENTVLSLVTFVSDYNISVVDRLGGDKRKIIMDDAGNLEYRTGGIFTLRL
jgi:hypothetical protein